MVHGPIRLPGFGLPLNFFPPSTKDNFLCVFASTPCPPYAAPDRLPLTTLREFTMLDLMNRITDMPDWHLEIFDELITSKRRAEALATERLDVSETMLDWCTSELRYKAELLKKTGAVSVYRGDVIKSDLATSASLKDKLKHAAAPLEDVPDEFKDWHLDSHGQVLDLVHPSLYPLIYGGSFILYGDTMTLADCVEKSGDGLIILLPEKREYRLFPYSNHPRMRMTLSKKSQWLPCDVDISSDDGKAKITSYINNLHPNKHADLYRVIEEIISCTLPIWNLTLTPLRAGQLPPRITHDLHHACNTGPGLRNHVDGDTRPRLTRANPDDTQPEPGKFVPPREHERPLDLRMDYRDSGLQIIVKLTNIYLTPEDPVYNGDTWHIDGLLNERICATAKYCYEFSNLSNCCLAFRQQSNPGHIQSMPGPSHERDWLKAVFGCEDQGPAVQDAGVVHFKEGRLVTWPNILQHKLQPFRLADPTKPGYCKILTLFLVDPNSPIISTADVPCQRKDWWIEAVRRVLPLPVELQDLIFESVDDSLLGLKDAMLQKQELTEGREALAELQDKAFCRMRICMSYGGQGWSG